MIHQLTDLPLNIVGFKATGEITEKDFTLFGMFGSTAEAAAQVLYLVQQIKKC
jgi:hypothetical protein